LLKLYDLLPVIGEGYVVVAELDFREALLLESTVYAAETVDAMKNRATELPKLGFADGFVPKNPKQMDNAVIVCNECIR